MIRDRPKSFSWMKQRTECVRVATSYATPPHNGLQLFSAWERCIYLRLTRIVFPDRVSRCLWLTNKQHSLSNLFVVVVFLFLLQTPSTWKRTSPIITDLANSTSRSSDLYFCLFTRKCTTSRLFLRFSLSRAVHSTRNSFVYAPL